MIGKDESRTGSTVGTWESWSNRKAERTVSIRNSGRARTRGAGESGTAGGL